jgi:hypothetical protein
MGRLGLRLSGKAPGTIPSLDTGRVCLPWSMLRQPTHRSGTIPIDCPCRHRRLRCLSYECHGHYHRKGKADHCRRDYQLLWMESRQLYWIGSDLSPAIVRFSALCVQRWPVSAPATGPRPRNPAPIHPARACKRSPARLSLVSAVAKKRQRHCRAREHRFEFVVAFDSGDIGTCRQRRRSHDRPSLNAFTM